MNAKSSSLWGQVIASVWVAGWSAYMFFTKTFDMSDVILSGVTIAACFTPVYFSIIMDKIKDIKIGKGS
jgi:hypothetical protein